MNHFIKHRVASGLMIAALIFAVSACDSSSAVDGNEDVASEIVASVSFVASDMDLSASEADALSAAFSKHEGDAREPGFLWKVAGELQQTLSEEQIQRLLDRLDNRGNIFGRPGFDHGHGGGFDRRFKDRPGFGHFGGAPAAGAFADALGLDEDQKVAIAALTVQFRLDVNDLRRQHHDGSLSDEDFKAELEALGAAFQTAWQDLLTEDQKAILEQLKADRQAALEERKEAREAHRDAARAVMIAVLGLSTDQVGELDALHEKVKELRGAFQELIDSGATREEVKEWAQESTDEVTEELKAILTQTQLEIFVIHGMLESRAGHRFRHMQGFGGANG